MAKYSYIEDLIPHSLVEKLQAELPAGLSWTIYATGPLSRGEQQLPLELVEAVRAAFPFAGRSSVQVRLHSTGSVAREARRGKAGGLAKRWPPQVVADAAGVSPAQARLLGAKPIEVHVQDDPRLLWAGLAAIRQAAKISQATIAGRIGASPMHISNCEGRLASTGDPGDVEQYVEVLAALLGLRSNRLRKRALLAGAAILDYGVPNGPAAETPDPGEPEPSAH